MEYFKIFIGISLMQGTLTRSIQNFTIDDSKVVTTDMLDARLKNMTNLMTDMLEKHMTDHRKHVFFYAKMSASNVALNTNSILKFGNVLNNEGNHFNSGDSIFIAPVSGVYMFSWNTHSQTSKSAQTELRVNNIVMEILNVQLGGSAGHLSFTRIVVCHVEKDYHVWIQTGSTFSENFFDSEYHSRSSFMGILMYET